MSLNHVHNISELRELAMRKLPRFVFEYLEGGAEDELTLSANRRDFNHWQLIPHHLNNVATRSCNVHIWEQDWALPLGIAPVGMAGLFWPHADVAAARAAALMQVPYILSTASSSSLEEVIQANPRAWFQLYVLSEELAQQLTLRALHAGYQTLVITVDVPVGGRRERDLRNGLKQPLQLSPRILVDVLKRPRWSASILQHGQPDMANLRTAQTNCAATQAALLNRKMDTTFDWKRLAQVRSQWPRRLIVKGLQHAADVERAFALGADGVIVSNHGGRQLDGAISSLSALPAAVEVAKGKPVFFDSGIRRGTDILKALALGATAVFAGRAPMYGLACKGEQGVIKAVELLAQELDTSLALLGCNNIQQVNRTHIRHGSFFS